MINHLMMKNMNTPSRPQRKPVDVSSQPSAKSSAFTMANPIESIIAEKDITVSSVRLYCQGSTAEVALILDNGTTETPATTGTIHVGQHWGDQPAQITLPSEGLVVNSTPVNEQDPSWNDEFSTKVEGNQLFVSRVDGGGLVWGQELELSWTQRPFVELVIGTHTGPGPKEVSLPQGLPWEDYTISGTPVNPQQDGWTDSFEAAVVDGKLVVSRTDSDENTWGQPLRLRAYRKL